MSSNNNNIHIFIVATESVCGHIPAIVKRGVIGSKGGWVLSIIVCCKVFRDWSIINIQERSQFY